MSRIIIAAYGSRGDIMPLTDFGARLLAGGHDVLLTSPPDMIEEIAACGLRTRAIDFDIEGGAEAVEKNPLAAARQLVSPRGMRQLGNNLLTALEGEPADILLLTPFAELAGHPLAESRNIPSLGVRLQPMSAAAAFPPALLGAWSAGSSLNRMAGKAAAGAFDRVYGGTVASFRRRLGLEPASQRKLRKRRTDAEWPILHGFSPSVLERPQDWRPGLEVVGYWWPQNPAGWQPSPGLTHFLDSGPAPVFIGLGSLMLPKAEAESISRIVAEALETLGLRGVVQAGGAGLAVEGDDMITIDAVPHDWLFGKMAAVVHSCGAGTAAAGLRAGKPAVAVPSPGGDQPFWARRLADLGVSSTTIRRPKLTAQRLAGAIDKALDDAAYAKAAGQISDRIVDEDGAGAVVAAVQRLLDD